MKNLQFVHHFTGVYAFRAPRCQSLAAAAVVVALALSSAPASGQTEAKGFVIGFEQRVRNEQWANILDFNDQLPDDRNQIRWRTRVWTNVPLTKDIDVFASLNQETNQIVSPRRPWRMDEVILENAYIDIKKLFSSKWSLRLGRQNIALGEGFLVLDGGPWDGSRAIYFNAASVAYTTGKSKLQFLAIADPRTESFLPTAHCQHRSLIEWDEHAAGAYFTTKPFNNSIIDVYGFWKRESHDARPANSVQFQPDKRVNTAGARLSQRVGKSYAVVGEYAQQWGRQAPGTRVTGRGGYAYLRRTVLSSRQGYLQGGYWAFSGDDPSTPAVEDWDPIFSRWPKWSELYIYSQFNERGVGYWTNLGMWQAEAGFSPVKKTKVRGTYYYMSAFHPFTRGNSSIFGAGSGRGHNWQVRGDVALSRNISGHAVYERHVPGDFYSKRTPGHFLRFEMIFNWSRTWPVRSAAQ